MAFDASTLKQKPSPEQVPTTTVRQHLVLSPSDPLKSARRFISCYYTEDSFRTLHRHKGGFYTYTGTHYRCRELGLLDTGNAKAV